MSKFKDFGSGNVGSEKESISFKLYDKEFFCLPELQGKVLLGFVASSAEEDPSAQAKAIEAFFDYVLTADSLIEFDLLTTSKDKIVSVETLSEIIAWIVEQYTDRPEEQPEDSQAGQ
jgi:hypothetical protein